MSSHEKLVMTCDICECEMIALHGFFVTCPNCPEQNEAIDELDKTMDLDRYDG